jgi:hypothetical protein
MTKGSGHMLFVADSTRARMQRPRDDLVHVGEFDVRGRAAKLAVWTITNSQRAVQDGTPEA